MKGRKPLPTALKVLNGSYDKDPQRRNDAEPQPIPGAPAKPEYLDETASTKWDELCEHLDAMGILATSDGDLMEVYCVTYSAYRQALLGVNRTGQVLVTKGKNGVEVKRNPFSVELHKYRDALLKMQPEMGLTASSRSRMVVPGRQSVDPLDEFSEVG